MYYGVEHEASINIHKHTQEAIPCHWTTRVWRFECMGGLRPQTASEAIFRARAYSHNLFSPVMRIT